MSLFGKEIIKYTPLLLPIHNVKDIKQLIIQSRLKLKLTPDTIIATKYSKWRHSIDNRLSALLTTPCIIWLHF